jgi:NAD dependent epimerase/dehydratase family enzyme
VPAFAIKALFGPAAVVLLTGQTVLPTAALEAGFEFDYRTIEAAFENIYA